MVYGLMGWPFLLGGFIPVLYPLAAVGMLVVYISVRSAASRHRQPLTLMQVANTTHGISTCQSRQRICVAHVSGVLATVVCVQQLTAKHCARCFLQRS